MRWKLLYPLSLVLLVGGCSIVDPKGCTDSLVPGIAVRVMDLTTMEPLPVESWATASATETSYSDARQLPAGDSGPAPLAFERPGAYRVEVTAGGYEWWVRTDVRVSETDDGCHVRTVDLTARMQPVSE